MKKVTFLTCFLVALISEVLAQNPEEIFWEISGNGLEKPSYLYGTIHIMDDRAFNFNDSLFIKMKECDAFALEVHPDSIIKKLFTDFFDKKDRKDNKLKELLSDKDYKELSEKFSEQTGFDLEDVNTSNPSLIKQMISRDISGRADNSTFLDAYLYSIAKSWGKKITGVENYEDQMLAFGESDVELKRGFEKILSDNDSIDILFKNIGNKQLDQLIRLYQEGNLKNIDAFLKENTSGDYYQKMIVVRNKVMLNTTLHEMHRQPIFIAVGIGHLGGEEGLVNLLRNEGYTLRPITPLYTGKAKKIKLNSRDESWYSFVSGDLGYQLELPQAPFDFKPSSIPLKIYMYPDLGSGLVYFHMAMNTMDSKESEDMLELMGENLVKNSSGKLIKEKKYKYRQYPGKELIFRDPNGYFFKIRLIARDMHIYAFMIGSKNNKDLDGFESRRFLDSFEIIPFDAQPQNLFYSAKGGFEVNFPGEPQTMVQKNAVEDEPEMEYVFNFFMASDLETGLNYITVYYDMPAGNVVDNDSIYLQEISGSYLQSFNGELTNTWPLKLDGYYGLRTEAINETSSIYFQNYIRGNRCYVNIATATDSSNSRKHAEGFFNSFRFKEFQKPVWQTFDHSDKDFSMQFPGEVVTSYDTAYYLYEPNDSYINIQYASVDDNSGMAYIFLEEIFNKYAHFENEENYFETQLQTYADPGDSIFSAREITWGKNQKGRQLLISNDENSFDMVVNIYPSRDRVYSQWVYVNELELTDSIYEDDFIRSFELNKSEGKSHIFKTKEEARKLLLQDATTMEKGDVSEINEVIAGFSFNEDELPMIYEIIENIQDNPTEDENELKKNFIRILAKTNDERTIDLLKNQYRILPDSSDIKIAILETLTEINSRESLNTFKDFLVSSPPEVNNNYEYYTVFSYLEDSIENFPLIVNDLIPLINDPFVGSNIVNTTIMALDSGVMEPTLLDQHVPMIREQFYTSWQKLKETSPDSSDFYQRASDMKNSIGLIRYTNMEDSAKSILRGMDLSYPEYFLFEVLKANVMQGMEPEKVLIDQLCKNEYWLIDVVELFDKSKMPEYVPAEWNSQKKVAYSQMLNYLEMIEDYADTLVIIETREVEKDGAMSRFYVFKLGYLYEDDRGDEVSEWYLGLCGMYSLEENKILPLKKFAYSSWEEFSEGETDLNLAIDSMLEEDGFY